MQTLKFACFAGLLISALAVAFISLFLYTQQPTPELKKIAGVGMLTTGIVVCFTGLTFIASI